MTLSGVPVAACSPYTLHGRVVAGDSSYVAVVEQGDPRLAGPGLPGVLLKLRTDPGKLNRKTVAQETSDTEGEFSLPIDEFGAGLLRFDMGLVARRRGYQSAEGAFRLPSGSRRILIVLTPGQDAPGAFEEPESLSDEARRYR